MRKFHPLPFRWLIPVLEIGVDFHISIILYSLNTLSNFLRKMHSCWKFLWLFSHISLINFFYLTLIPCSQITNVIAKSLYNLPGEVTTDSVVGVCAWSARSMTQHADIYGPDSHTHVFWSRAIPRAVLRVLKPREILLLKCLLNFLPRKSNRATSTVSSGSDFSEATFLPVQSMSK